VRWGPSIRGARCATAMRFAARESNHGTITRKDERPLHLSMDTGGLGAAWPITHQQANDDRWGGQCPTNERAPPRARATIRVAAVVALRLFQRPYEARGKVKRTSVP